MPLTEEQAFKVGFLKKCAEEGLTLDETKQRVKLAIHVLREKRALFGVTIPGEETIPWALGKGLSAGGIAAVGLPVVAGAGAGYLAAKGTSGGNDAVADAKQNEIIGEYERLADEARRRARLKQLQTITGRRVIALTPGEGS